VAAALAAGCATPVEDARTVSDEVTTTERARPSTTTTRPATTTTTAPTTTTTAPPPTTTTAPPPPPTTVPPPPPTTAAPAPPPTAPPPAPTGGCDGNYTGCVPIASDVDCQGGTGNGPAYVAGPVQVVGSDVYGLDSDGDGVGCE
jgi:hypothetical protein